MLIFAKRSSLFVVWSSSWVWQVTRSCSCFHGVVVTRCPLFFGKFGYYTINNDDWIVYIIYICNKLFNCYHCVENQEQKLSMNTIQSCNFIEFYLINHQYRIAVKGCTLMQEVLGSFWPSNTQIYFNWGLRWYCQSKIDVWSQNVIWFYVYPFCLSGIRAKIAKIAPIQSRAKYNVWRDQVI